MSVMYLIRGSNWGEVSLPQHRVYTVFIFVFCEEDEFYSLSLSVSLSISVCMCVLVCVCICMCVCRHVFLYMCVFDMCSYTHICRDQKTLGIIISCTLTYCLEIDSLN